MDELPPGKVTATSLIGKSIGPYPTVPGKRTLAEMLPIRRKQGGGATTTRPADIARAGTSGSGQPLPHLERIQRLFGHHDLTGVRAHTDASAHRAANELGASAYAIGNDVAFAEGGADLHTAAHEAAHVVQQRQGVQAKGGLDGGRADPYERHADAVADTVVRGHSAEALLGTAVTAGGAPEAVQRKEGDVDKVAYVTDHLVQIVDGARATLATQALSTFSKYATWSSPSALASAVAKSALPSSVSAPLLQAWLQPQSVYDIAERARMREVDASGDGGGTNDWQPAVGAAVGAGVAERLTESVRRVMPRYLDARYQAMLAEEKTSGACKLIAPEPLASEITPSHPLDAPAIAALCSGIVSFSVDAYRADAKDDKPKFRKPIAIDFHWDSISLGAYWIVAKPPLGPTIVATSADITVEDVALTLFGSPAEAHELVAAPPRYGFTHAYKLLKPHLDYLTSQGEDLHRDADPTRMLLDAPGPAADEAALAQTQGAQSGKSIAEITGKLRESLLVFDKIGELAKKLGVGTALDSARSRLDKRVQEFSKPGASFAEVAKWENHTFMQGAVLSRIAFGLGALDERLTAMTAGMKGTAPAFEKLDLPHYVKTGMKRVATAFVDAALASHLPTTADAKCAAAEQQNQLLPVEILEGVLTDVLKSIADTQRAKKEFTDFHPDFYPGPYKADPADTKRMQEQAAVLREELATIRATLLNDPTAAAAAFKRIQEKVLDLQNESELVGNADELDRLWIELERAVYRSPLPSEGPIPTPNPLWDKIGKLQKDCFGYRGRWEAAHKKFKGGDKEGAKTEVTALKSDPRLPAFLGDCTQALKDSYALEAINKISALLAITVVTMGVGAWVGGVAVGLELGTGATIVTVSAAEAATFTLLSQAFLDSDHSVKHIAGELLFNFGMFAALRTFSKMIEAAKLAKAVTTVADMSAQAVILGASTYAKERFIEKGRPLTDAEVKQLCIEGVVMFVAIAILGRVAQPILKELEGAGHGLGARISAANAQREAVQTLATALKGSPGDVAKALETITAERTLLKARLDAYDALQARMADEAKNPPKKGESVFDKTGLTPDRVSEIQQALATAQKEMKAAEVMLTLESIAPDTYACPKDRVDAVLKELGGPLSTTEEGGVKTYTARSPDGRTVKIIERVAAPEAKVADPTGAPKIDTSHLPEGAQSIERWQTQAVEDTSPDLWNKKSSDGRLFRDVYAQWMQQPERVKKTRGGWETVYPDGCPAAFKPLLDGIVHKHGLALATQGQANTQRLRDAGIDLEHLDPTTAEYLAKRPTIVEILGEKAVLDWESTKVGDAGKSAASKQVHKLVSEEGLAALRAAFPDCEILLTGSAAQGGKDTKTLEIILVTPEGTTMEARIGLEKRAAAMAVKAAPEHAAAGGAPELKVDAKAMTQGEYLGHRTAAAAAKALDDVRIDTMGSVDATKWVEALRARMSTEELAKLDQMTRGKPPEQTREMFEGRLDHAIARVREAIAKTAEAQKVKADSSTYAKELKRLIQDKGLMNDPEIQKAINSIKPDNSNLPDVVRNIRGRLAGEIAARSAEAKYPGAEVLREIKVWTEYPERDRDTWRANHPEMKPDAVLSEKNGRVHLLSTEIDVLVITPREPGKPSKILERQEVKSGANDTFSEAQSQLLKQGRRLAGDAGGGTKILLEHNGANITDQIDMASDASAKMTAIGAAGKDGFKGAHDGVAGEQSKITAGDLEKVVKELVDLQRIGATNPSAGDLPPPKVTP